MSTPTYPDPLTPPSSVEPPRDERGRVTADPGSPPLFDRAHRILLETARQLGSSLEPQAIFARLQNSVCGAVRCDGLIVSSFDRKASLIRCEYAWVGGNVLDPTTLPPLVFRPDSSGMQTQVIRTGRPMLFSDVAERVRDPKGRYYEVDKAGGVRDLKTSGPPDSHSALMVPLLLEGEVVGVVQVMADQENAHTRVDLEMLEGISLLLAVALENARLYRRANDDLEERRRAERVLREAEDRYRAFVSQSTEGIYRLELEPPIDVRLPVEEQVRLAYERGKLAECNDAFARMYGYDSADEMIGLGLDPILPSSDPACRAYLGHVIESGYRVTDTESDEVNRYGEPVCFSNNIQGVVENGYLVRVWGTQRDISDRRRNEQALLEADRRKDEFLATLGHELRNPLNPILNAVELLRRRETTDPDSRRSHAVILRQIVHLTRLIDDLLDVSRITQGKLELRRARVELDPILAGAIDSVRPQLAAAGQRLTVHPASGPIGLDADPVRLAQVFSNLLDNASKYTARGGSIDVMIERRGSEAVISVRDDGSGIPREHLPHLFDLFYQADQSVGRTQGGLGIGLTLVKRLIEMHGGTIEAYSEGSGRGSRFVVRLPAVAPIETAAPAAAVYDAPMGASRPRRILIADDNRDSADTMALLLRMGGNEVEIAYDGEEAVRVADGFQPEVLLLDIGMPRLNGYEVAREVRARPWGRDTVLIAATGWGQEEDRRRSMETGFDAHLVKPVDHDALKRLLAELPRRVSA
jgi:PAS domain S-box-containing protein